MEDGTGKMGAGDGAGLILAEAGNRPAHHHLIIWLSHYYLFQSTTKGAS